MSHEQTKAAHYIHQLDEARCQGSWDKVPELVRKVRKHAPARSCLALTAEAEHAVTKASHTLHVTARPSTAASTKPSPLSKYIPLLLEAIHKERKHPEDEFQAQVCLGWIHWQLGEPSLAVARLPKSIEEEFSQLDGTNKESAEWTKVCALKASYIKGNSQGRTGAVVAALETFESALPVLSSVSSSKKQGKELRSWIELFLTGFCIISSHAIKSKISSVLETETLSAFRAWARFWETQTQASTGGYAPQAEVSRRHVWKEYYITLSELLQQELPFPVTDLAPTFVQTSTRIQQRAELKRVEARYEALLLSEVKFPKADEASEEMEWFVDIVMQNWRILCGSSWNEQDLGEGGAETVSRGILDILYRAASKTFHSTAVLRHLFTVHLTIAEFDLAFKAFDTYIEMVKKGKARVKQTGELEQSLDDDETVLKTASECIKALCRYGSRPAVEKAKDLGQFFEDWLDTLYPTERNLNGRPNGNGASTDLGTIIAPRTLALAWRYIGISHAQWARLTFEASSRGDIQLRAIKCLRKALLPQYESTTEPETLFALGTILAERRELGAAIDVVKSGLLPTQSPSQTLSSGLDAKRFDRERSLIPLWHLMALFLSARQEFVTAARSCEGAFEQFQDPKNLFGDADLHGTYRSEHLNLNEKAPAKMQGIVDDMDDFEKENVLEVKMTQLSLIEVLEGPEVAVNASDELLSLYRRLFGDPQKHSVTLAVPTTTTAGAPRSSAGTMKSIKGSIFGRSKRPVKSSYIASSSGDKSASTLRPQTAQTTTSTRAPTIQVTNENGSSAKHHHHHLTKEHPPQHHDKLRKRSESFSGKKQSSSIRNRSISTGRTNVSGTTNVATATTVGGGKFSAPSTNTHRQDQRLDDGRGRSPARQAAAPDNTSIMSSSKGTHPNLTALNSKQTADKANSLLITDSNPGLVQDRRPAHISHYSTTSPITRFPRDQERRRRTGILVKLWLLIGAFYRRAALYDDAKGAIEEAHNLVLIMEGDISRDTTGNVSTSQVVWGGGKSVEELFGDVYSERACLAVAESSPYVALTNFELALNHFADHPSAIVGLSNILLDIYTEDLQPLSVAPSLILPGSTGAPSASTVNTSATPATAQRPRSSSNILTSPSTGPLGLPSAHPIPSTNGTKPSGSSTPTTATSDLSPSTNSNKESSTAFLDRLAARDRAFGLLNGLTKLGSGWNYSEAWFALARAYELGGQDDKAREVLWWCVELEDGRGVREWGEVWSGYVL